MLLTTLSPLHSTAGTCLSQRFSKAPFFRFENPIPEETKILDLEEEIFKREREGEPVGSLKEERKKIYDSWIARLDREIGNSRKNKGDQEDLKRQRERAERDYG